MLWNSDPQGNGVGGIENAVKALLVVSIFLILIPSASAIDISSVTAPESVVEGELLSVSFTAANHSGNETYKILRNGQNVSNESYFDWQTAKSDEGTYTFTFKATDGNETAEEQKVIEVLDSPSTVKINNPPSGVITDEQLRISAEAMESANSCTYTLGDTSGNLNDGEEEWFKIILVEEGVHNLTVECSGNNETAKDSTVFIVDTTPPSITSTNPEGSFSGTPIQIEATTNENSVCRYSRNDSEFSQMSKEFSQTGGRNHKQIVDISNQGEATYYVACEDRHGNRMNSNQEISFFANLRPSAEITLEQDADEEDLLKPGTYEIKVETSEPVQEPTLKYDYSKSGGKKEISLQGSGTNWEGFIAIGEDIENDVGTFYFNAKDMTDQEGSEITKGKIFLVDTQDPDAVESISVTRDGLDAKVEWVYEGEPVDYFEVYRSENPNLDRLDKWDETPEEFYLDQNALLGKRYYYRVAAVDKAGNVGPLSKPVDIVMDVNETQEEADPVVVRKLNETQELLQKKIFDADASINKLEKENNRAKNDVIRQLNLIQEAKEARRNIDNLIKEMDKLKLIGLTPSQANNRVKVFLNNADSQMARIAEEIEIIDSTTSEQVLMEQDIEEAIAELLVGFDLGEDQKQDYTARMKNLQDRISVSSEITTARVNFHTRPTSKELTMVHKKVISDSPVNDAVIVENIPKGVARRADDIIFKEEPAVLRPDPIVKWESTELTSKDLYYHVEKVADVSEVKNAKTVVLEKPEIKEDNEITGAVTGTEDNKGEGQSGSSDLGSMLMLLFGTVVAGGLLVYYVVYVKQDGDHNIMPGGMHPAQIQALQHQNNFIKPPSKPKHPKEALHLYHNIKRAHRRADSVKYEEALSLYKQILENLEKKRDSLDKKYVEKLEDETRKLYDKLVLISKLRESHESIDDKDYNGLKENMAEIKRLYHELGKGSELTEHTRKNYSYFINHLKSLDREEFFNNLEL